MSFIPKVLSSGSILALLLVAGSATAQGTRLLSQPSISGTEVAFVYAGDIWVASKNGGAARRITSTPAVEKNPHFSPDGSTIAFSSDRTGVSQVYIVPAAGGDPKRLTSYPSPSQPRGWTPDGKSVIYASGRESAPTGYNRLWSVSSNGGPSTVLPAPWAFDGKHSPDSKKMIIDRV
ncbi:MAG TPA: hypothetical protein VLC28_13635, partial [Flavitalea sp.]|nr:hypothetical protein [Flavitalea sp.]